jgi:hypothetical protein
MSDYSLTKTRFQQGIWEGLVSGKGPDAPQPEIVVTHQQSRLSDVQLSDGPERGQWALRIPVPADRIGDGVQTFLIQDGRTDETLGHFALSGGEALADDILTEMQLLREELDMLKRAFRRHCLETMQP